MPKFEIKLDVAAPSAKIYNILNDDSLETVWNLTVNESKKIGQDIYAIKSTVGNLTSIITERLKNKKISFKIEGGPFNAMGYILNPKGLETEITGWAEYANPNEEKMLRKAGEILLKSLKKFAEFLEGGGNPSTYRKK
ncbi:MAG: hypothetical protein ACFFKA_07680 [Candidatus Thorarchaeota archaeon]